MRIEDLPVMAAKFTLPDGTTLERSWSMADVDAGAVLPVNDGPPPWLTNARRELPHPQDPVTFTGTVTAGHEDDARRYLGIEDGGGR